ncbi:hypothetical protein E0L36_04515 [Streptomyces sp. AJS327]|uniref:hypothetical protein n=1 Tax=Streptomyces sp. AJS327 TaxID=2545265 RepID=UPI0015DF651E|nr:hypothetical protein [Streptomyces sp. AJS327]MBA0050186.1 hypothetical protein [Streptomyces sp. AJS327]
MDPPIGEYIPDGDHTRNGPDGYRCPPELDRPILAVALTCVTGLLTLAIALAACQPTPTPPPSTTTPPSGGQIPTRCPTADQHD